MKDTVAIIETAPVYLPSTSAEAIAYYSIRKPTTRQEIMNLARLIHIELDKMDKIIDDAVRRCEEKHRRELEGVPEG